MAAGTDSDGEASSWPDFQADSGIETDSHGPAFSKTATDPGEPSHPGFETDSDRSSHSATAPDGAPESADSPDGAPEPADSPDGATHPAQTLNSDRSSQPADAIDPEAVAATDPAAPSDSDSHR